MTITKTAWTQQAAAALARAAGPDLLAIQAEVTSGEAELWYIDGHGYLVTRLEIYPEGRPVLVLVAGAGAGLPRVVYRFQCIAQSRGYAMRIHTRRPGVARMLRRLQFAPAGTDPDGYTIHEWRP